MASLTGTMSGNIVRFSPKRLMKSFEELSRAEMCLIWSTAVSRMYDLYESPIQRSRDLIKSAFIPASSSRMTAHTLIECDVKHIISSLVRSGWQIFATDGNTSAILLAVRYFVKTWWLVKIPIGWSLDWPRQFARRKIQYAARTRHLSKCLLSATKLIDWPLWRFFCIRKVSFIFVGGSARPSRECTVIKCPVLS